MKDLSTGAAGPLNYEDEFQEEAYEPLVSENLQLKGHVIYQELREILQLPEGHHRWKERFEFKKIGNVLYAKTEAIADPVIRQAAMCCTKLDNFVPLAELMVEVGASSDARKKALREELAARGLIHALFNTYLVEIGLEAAKLVNDPAIIAQFMDRKEADPENEESDDNYFDEVIEITQSIKIGGWK